MSVVVAVSSVSATAVSNVDCTFPVSFNAFFFMAFGGCCFDDTLGVGNFAGFLFFASEASLSVSSAGATQPKPGRSQGSLGRHLLLRDRRSQPWP